METILEQGEPIEMCTPSTVEMYRVVNIDDPDTYPGTFGFDNIDSIHVVSSLTEAELEASALENTDKKLLRQDQNGSNNNKESDDQPDDELPCYKSRSFHRQLLATVAANMVHLSAGYAAGYSAPTMAAIQKDFDLQDSTKNWFASILVVGQIFGCIAGGMATEKFGRRRCLIAFLSLSIVGWSIVAISSMHPDQDVAVILLFTGRFLHGLADSLGVSPAIIMVSEVSTVKLRGIFMNSVSIAACSGIPLAYIIGSYVPWQWAAAIGCCFPIFGVLLFLTFVREESPTFLWTKGHRQESLSALKWYRKGLQPDQILDEFHAMEKSSSSAGTKTSEKERKCCSAFAQEETLKPFVIVLAFLGLVPLTGIMSVTFFAIELFEGLGFGDSTLLVAVSAGTLRAIGSAIAGVIVVFKGRRFVLLFSCFGAIVAIEIATAAMLIKQQISSSVICDYVLIFSIPAYMFFLGIGMTPVPWILLGEWFVSETRSMAGGISSAMFFLSALISLQMTSFLERTIGVHGMFTSFGFICILFAVIAYKLVPETHGKSYRDSVLVKSLLEKETTSPLHQLQV